jgi:6-phosphogluconolactonase (cycloisomerase 2 family)
VTHALFVETDATSGNQILSYLRGADGTISFAGKYATGGLGGVASGATADPLASQDGLLLTSNGQVLVATNAGSNTLSVFSVQGTTLQLEQRISSFGQFPVSLSAHGKYVAVLNSGGAGSVTEYSLDGVKLHPVTGQIRSLGLSNTNPPVFTAGPGEIAYSPDGTRLVISDKHSNDSFSVFSVSTKGVLGTSPVVTAAANAVPFSFVFDAHGNIVDTEASNSSVNTYGFNNDGSLAAIGSAADGQKALCWISSARGFYFGSNAGSANVSSFTVSPSGVVTLVNASAASTHTGTTDSVSSADGHFLYVESGGVGALDVFAVGSDGSLSPVQTTWNIPAASEGLAIS